MHVIEAIIMSFVNTVNSLYVSFEAPIGYSLVQSLHLMLKYVCLNITIVILRNLFITLLLGSIT